MKKVLALSLFLMALNWTSALFAQQTVQSQNVRYDFNSEQEVKDLLSRKVLRASDNNKVKWIENPRATGNGALMVDCSHIYRGQIHLSVSDLIPKDSTEGVLSFWIYDDLNSPWRYAGKSLSLYIGAVSEKNGKPVRTSFSFSDFLGRGYGGWVFKDFEDNKGEIETLGLRHDGWTRFDIINPKGNDPQHFTICIDGREVIKTFRKYVSLSSFSITVGSHVMHNIQLPLYVDGISYNTNPDSYRPSVIQAINAEKTLNVGEKLPVELALAPKGAKQQTGQIKVKVYNAVEDEISQQQVDVDWSKQKSGKLTIELPSPPRSGAYWLEALYSEKGMVAADSEMKRVNVQFLTPGFEKIQHQEISFDDYWQFIPMNSTKVPASVPTDWSKAYPVLNVWTTGYVGKTRLSKDIVAGWFHRIINIPQSWQDQDIKLDIYDPCYTAHVFINKKPVGEIRYPGGNLDLTDVVKPGQTAELDIFVDGTRLDAKRRLMSKLLKGSANVPIWVMRSNEKGLEGKVALTAEPKGSRIADVGIRTYIDGGKRLWVEFECAGLTPQQKYVIKSVASAAGDVDKQIPDLTFTAKAAKQTVHIETPWTDPKLWDVYKPYLYRLNAKLESADGKVLDVIKPERFGFREIKTKGRFMALNGNPIMFFNPRGTNKNMFKNFGVVKALKDIGYNSIYRAQSFRSHVDPEFFDEAGIPRRMRAAEGRFNQIIYRQLMKYGHGDDPRFVEAWKHDAEYFVKRFRNSPSVIWWESADNSETTHLEPNPILEDGEFVNPPKDEEDAKCTAMGDLVYDYIKSLDPTRYVDANTTQNRYDTISHHNYYGFRHIQDIIEHNEHWIKYGNKPLYYHEVIAPFITDWCNSPWEGGGGHTSPRKVPQVVEWCAETMGDEAFIRKEPAQQGLKAFEETALANLAKIDKIKDPQAKAKAKGIKNIGRALLDYQRAMSAVSMKDNIMHNLWFDRTREMVFNWRADGVAGVALWLGEAVGEPLFLEVVQAPIIGFIAGTPEKRTAKDHIFAPGETLDRFVLVHNNSRDAAKLNCQWKLVLDKKTTAQNSQEFSLSPGGQFRVPVKVKIPAGTSDKFGTLSMALTQNGKLISTDSVAIQVLAPEPSQLKKAVALIDPEAKTLAEFKRLGIKFKIRSFNSDFREFDTLVFGRNAFKYEMKINPEGLDLAALTKQGKNILILEQPEDILRNRFKFRTENLGAHNVYSRINDGMLFKGLPDSCLKFWRGSATLTDGRAMALNDIGNITQGSWYPYTGNDGKPKNRFIRWGNTDIIVTIALIKPDTGNFRVLVDCGFNLNYAGAVELSNAKGHVVFNQLDVIARTETDPAAERYLKNLVAYTSELKPTNWRTADYVGDDKGKELLEFLRIDFKRITSPKDAGKDSVIVLGSLPTKELVGLKDSLTDYVNQGGTVFCLPKTIADFKAGFLPFNVDVAKKTVNCSGIGKSQDPLLQGLGNADFFWKGNVDIVALNKVENAALLVDSGILARIPHGKGEYVLCQIDPSIFNVDLRFWLERSKRTTERTLIKLLANSDVEMASPYLLRAPKAKFVLADTIDLAGNWEVTGGTITDKKAPAGSWKKVALPGGFHKALPKQDKQEGVIWYRRTIDLKKQPQDAIVKLAIGRISGSDTTYINGKEVGKSNLDTHVNTVATINRLYLIDRDVLKAGKNTIEIKVKYDVNALLGMANSDGSIEAPVAFEVYQSADNFGAVNLEPISLERKWKGNAVGSKKLSCPAKNDPNWHDVTVPAQYEKENEAWDNYNGHFWYRTSFKLAEELPAKAEPFFIAGGIDDWDTTYVNGKEIGHTTPENFFTLHSAYNTPRKYPIPRELLTKGVNEISVLVDDPQNDGGIWKGPVEIIFADPLKVARQELLKSSYLTLAQNDEDPYVARHW